MFVFGCIIEHSTVSGCRWSNSHSLCLMVESFLLVCAQCMLSEINPNYRSQECMLCSERLQLGVQDHLEGSACHATAQMAMLTARVKHQRQW